MKKFLIFIFTFVLFFSLIQSQSIKKITPKKPFKLLTKYYVKVLCMNKWKNGSISNSAMVVLKKMSSTGPVINDAKVVVNNKLLTFNSSINEYMGNIGNVNPGNAIYLKIKFKNGDVINGKVLAKYFIKIIHPTKFQDFKKTDTIRVAWRFSDGGIYPIVLTILKGSTQLYTLSVPGGLTHSLVLSALALPISAGDVIDISVISPWVSVFNFSGPYAAGSKGDFFSRATVSVKII